jgi:hypothetical protein
VLCVGHLSVSINIDERLCRKVSISSTKSW